MGISLSQAEVDHFHSEGFLAIDDLLDVQEDIQPVWAEYEDLLDRLCTQWQAEGRLSSAYRGLSLGQRLIRVYQESGADYCQPFDISLPQSNLQADTPFHAGPAVFRLLSSPRLLDAVEDLIGPEIYSNPVQHVRIKIPERWVREDANPLNKASSWHQDQGVVLPEADDSDILTVWIAITEATVDNGCLVVIPRSHREELALHCPGTPGGKGFHIPDPYLRLNDARPVPLRPGGVLFMHRRTEHSSYSNHSDDIRFSLDLRYNPTGQPTGRPAFPGFVARSRSNPANVLTDPRAWAASWEAARAKISQAANPVYNRWVDSPEVCA